MLKKTSFLLFIIFTINTLSLFADKKQKEFNLKIIKSQVVDNSLYNQVEFIDSRPQHECMLISIDDSTFTNQLQTTLDYMIDNSARDNTLLLQLRHLYLKQESDKEMNIYAYINVYQKKNDRYFLLNTVNRRVKINNPDLTHDIITQAITQLLNNNLRNESTASTSYLVQEIEKIDLIEKADIKAYQTTDFVDGVYTNYEEFASQTPSITNMDVEMKKDQIKTIKIAMNGDSKMQKLDLKNNYAVVVNNIPYLILKNKYIPVTKEENELILQIDQKSMTNASLFLGGGLVGALLIPTNVKEESSTYIIDHLDGEVVLKEKKTVSYNKSIFSKRDLNRKDKTEYQ